MKVFLLLTIAAVSYGQWMEDCGRNMYDGASVERRGEGRSSGKIIGGHEADRHQFPWQVALTDPLTTDLIFCGGVILNAHYVLTAAHCTDGRETGKIVAITGRHERTTGGDVHDVAEIIQHEHYNKKTFDYDIALLRTKEPMYLSTCRAGPICPPNQETIPEHNRFIVSGWGVDSSGSFPSALLYTSPKSTSRKRCKQILGARVTDRMMCAHMPEGGMDACQGDSGGPLIFNRRLIGLVSWGDGCGERNKPGVYTNVYYFLDWIKEKAISPESEI